MNGELNKILSEIDAKARENVRLYQNYMAAWRANNGSFEGISRPTYLDPSAEINGHKVSACFAETTRANCLRSLRTAGTMRWKVDGKVTKFSDIAKKVAA